MENRVEPIQLTNLGLKVLELLADASNRVGAGEVLLPMSPVTDFFDWLFDANSFECAVLIPRKGLLWRKHAAWPSVIVDAEVARHSRDVLEKAAQSGFELIIGTRLKLEDLSSFFCRLGYREQGEGIFGSGDKHDTERAAWNKESFAQGVVIATKLCAHPLCVFAHDGDPVYLLYGNS